MTKQAAGPSERRVQRPMHAVRVREVLRLQGSSWAEASDMGARLGISLPDFESWLAGSERLTLDQARVLSETTGTRLLDWLEALGYPLDEIAELQRDFHKERTHVLPRNLFGIDYKGMRFPAGASLDATLKRTTLASEAFRAFGLERLRTIADKSIADNSKARRHYGWIGERDASMAPTLWPRSIFRYNPEIRDPNRTSSVEEGSNPVWFLETIRGSICSAVEPAPSGIWCRPANAAYQSRYFQHSEYRIRGIVDGLIHWYADWANPVVEASPQALRRVMKKTALPPTDTGSWTPGGYVQQGRLRANLSMRVAAERSQRLAEHWEDDAYSIGKTTLDEIELNQRIPRLIETFVSIAVVCLLELEDLLRKYGYMDHEEEKKPLFPERVVESAQRSIFGDTVPLGRSDYFHDLMQSWGELPLHLLSFLPDWRMENLAILGRDDNLLAPAVQAGALLLINRKQSRWQGGPAQQPVLELVDTPEGLWCGVLSEAEGQMSIAPPAGSIVKARHFRTRSVDRLGRVIAIATRC
jgi:hypothetical protein